MNIIEKKLQVFCNGNLNVLLRGKHGVGKTELIKQTFKNANLNVGIFSASTLDAYVDLRGIPEIVTNDDGTRTLKFIQTAELQTFDAIFFDELNRATPATLNALFELIQNKSINGVRLPKLKMVWSAINPAESNEYTVDDLDPALVDRFQIQMEIPNNISKEYFEKKYNTDIAEKVADWWRTNFTESGFISPRRLDQAVAWMLDFGGSMRDFVPQRNIPIQFLEKAINKKSIIDTLVSEIENANNETEITKIINTPDNFITIKNNVEKLPKIIEKNITLLNAENKVTLDAQKTKKPNNTTATNTIQTREQRRYGLTKFDFALIDPALNITIDTAKINKSICSSCITVERLNKANNKSNPTFYDYINGIMKIDNMKDLKRKRHNRTIETALYNVFNIVTSSRAFTNQITTNEIQVINHLVYFLTVNCEAPVPINLIYANTPDLIKSHVDFVLSC